MSSCKLFRTSSRILSEFGKLFLKFKIPRISSDETDLFLSVRQGVCPSKSSSTFARLPKVLWKVSLVIKGFGLVRQFCEVVVVLRRTSSGGTFINLTDCFFFVNFF